MWEIMISFLPDALGGCPKWMAPFGKISRGHIRIVPGNMHVKFEVCNFSRFGAISI